MAFSGPADDVVGGPATGSAEFALPQLRERSLLPSPLHPRRRFGKSFYALIRQANRAHQVSVSLSQALMVIAGGTFT